MKIEVGDKEYVITSILECNQITYFYLISVDRPLNILLVKKLVDDNVETINSKEEKEYVLSRFNNIIKI